MIIDGNDPDGVLADKAIAFAKRNKRPATFLLNDSTVVVQPVVQTRTLYIVCIALYILSVLTFCS